MSRDPARTALKLVSASAVGHYGDRGDEELGESSQAGRGFLAEVCAEWEREALAAESLGIRVVCVRIGIVLAPFAKALGHAVHRPAFLPVSKTALRTAFGEMSEILMASQRVLPGVAERTGYAFKHTELEVALAAVMAASGRRAA